MRVLFLAGCFCFAVFWYRCHHRYVAGLITVFGIWFARYFDAVRTWIGFLGTDSLSEAQRFDWTEASFFLQTLSSILVPVSLHKWLETVGIAVVLVAVLVGAVKVLSRRSRRRITRRAATYSVLLLGCMGMGVAVSYPISQVVGRIQSNSSLYEGVRAHFSENAAKLDLVRNGVQGLRVVVYIGESTTAMHWSLYGYPIKTTPRLQAFAATHPGFLKFSHVMSTHTHTSPSLLQALSFGMSGESVYQRIYDARRASLVDVLARAGIPSLLLSAQGASGTYNLASSIIFSSVTERYFANPGSVLLGNMATIDQVPDGVFFHDVLGKFKAFHSEGTAVAFLHSYAGHGPYAENLPESSRLPLDPMFRGARPEDLFGSLQSTDLMDDLAAYESAMRYIDTNVAQVMEQAADATEPTVVLYFSDHGDSVGTARGHDSSRLQHEMMRVPFLMYFNEAAKRVAPDL